MPSITELKNEIEWRRCAADPVYFAQKYWWIQHPEGRRLFVMRPEQRETLGAFLTEKKTIILKARQIGYTTLTTFFAFWATWFHADRKVIILSMTEDDAFDALGMANFGQGLLPEWMKTYKTRRLDNNKSFMTFSNGSSIVVDAAKNDPARGQTAWLVVMDEAAKFPNPEDAWASIEPATDIGGRVCVLSTANGVGNWYHTQWLVANEPDSSWRHVFNNWRAVPERDDAWYEQKLIDYAHIPWFVHQEYPTTPEEAFLKSGNAFFDVEFLQGLELREPERGVLVEVF
jgi:hypothetical protein